MDFSLITNSFLLKWDVPDEWNTHINNLKVTDWRKATRTISITTILYFVTGLLIDERGLEWITILLFALGLSLFTYFVNKFTRWASNPKAKIYKSIIRVKYWDGNDDIEISKIDSYRFNRLNLNGSQISVLVLKLKNESVFEIGIPNQGFEEHVKTILSGKFSIPCFGSFHSQD
jgi:hypothetical protein